MTDARKLVRTATPGVYRRTTTSGERGQTKSKKDPYVVVFHAGGRQRKEIARTYEEARKLKAARTADVARGEFQIRTTTTFRAFLSEWVDRYHGTGRRGFREATRDEYRRLLDAYAHEFFGPRLRLVDVTAHHLAHFVGWLADEKAQARHENQLSQRRRDEAMKAGKMPPKPRKPIEAKRLADSTITNAVAPVRAALATAKREGLIRHNPATDLALPKRERIHEDEHEEVRPLSGEQLAALLGMVPERHGPLVELVAATGLRIGEAIALQRRHLHLDGSNPHVRVRRAIVRGRESPPKSKHARRSVPLSAGLVSKLRRHLVQLDGSPDALVFPSSAGTPLDPNNLRRRTLKPLMEEVGAPWAAWHTLRHTYASMQLAAGVNIVQLSRALGHHSASFTLDRYVHLMPGDMAPALDLDAEVTKDADGAG